jgi:hypothetical protein
MLQEYNGVHVDGYGSLLLSDSVSHVGPDTMLLSLTTITGFKESISSYGWPVDEEYNH